MDLLTLLKKSIGMEVKANETMHSTNTNAGEDWIPSEVFSKEVFDLVPQRSRLLPLLPGFHGTMLPKTYTAPVKGLQAGDLLFEGKTEWTTGTQSETENDHLQRRAFTQNVTLTQTGFICEIDVSDDLLRYSPVEAERHIKEELAKGMAYTVDMLIINGDNETGATGNVNSDDQAPATTFAALGGARYAPLRIDHGIRERAINGSYTVNAGTLDATDYLGLISLLGEYAEDPSQCLFIQQMAVRAKTLAISEFAEYQKYGNADAVAKGIMPTPYGVDILTHRGVPKTEADGKMSATGSNNTKGQILALYKPAVQYGFGKDLTLEVVRNPGYGYRIIATFDFSFVIVDSDASLTNPTVAAAINITV